MFPTGSSFFPRHTGDSAEYCGLYGAPLSYDPETVFSLKTASTHLSKHVVITKVALCALLSLAFYACSLWIWPICCYVVWVVYTQVVAPDPLIQAMHDLCGNKAAYEALPAFHFSLFRHEVKKLEWEKIPCPFIRVIHEDGRPGLMVKAISKGKKTLFIFLEKASPADYQSKPICHIISQAFMRENINKHLMFSNNDQSIFLAAKPLLLQRI